MRFRPAPTPAWYPGIRRSLLSLSCALLLIQVSQAQPRLRPPPQVECARDLLTSYAGEVRRYQVGVRRTQLVIQTDEQTRQLVVLDHADAKTPLRSYLLEGRSFEAGDLGQIEQSPGKLRPGVRAVAWVCSDGRQPLIDWHPPRER